MKRKFIAVLTLIMLVFTMIPVMASAEAQEVDNGFYYADNTKVPDQYELKYGETLVVKKVRAMGAKVTTLSSFCRSNSEVIDISANPGSNGKPNIGYFGVTISPKKNGVIKLGLFGNPAGDYGGQVVYTMELTVTGCPEDADTERREEYTQPQGSTADNQVNGTKAYAGVKLNSFQGSIMTVPNNEMFYENYITEQPDAKNITLDFDITRIGQFASSLTEDTVEEAVRENFMPKVQIKDMDGNIAASQSNGALELIQSSLKDRKTAHATISVKRGFLKPDTEYQLVIKPKVQLVEKDSLTYKDIVFTFTTRPFQYAEGVTVDKTAVTMEVNDTVELSAAVTPDDADDDQLNWESSDKSIAKVDSKGTVTAIKAGTAVVRAYNSNGKSGICKVTVKKVPVDKVTGLSAEAIAYNKAKLKWKAVNGASQYVVYQASKKNGAYKKIAAVKKNTCTVGNLKLGKNYFFKVKAVKTVNGTKYYGALSKAEMGNSRIAKTALTSKAEKGKVVLKWKKAAGADTYQVYKSKKKDSGYYKLRQTVKLNWTDTKVTSGEDYYYKARSYKIVNGKKMYSKFTAPVKVCAK